MSNDKLRILMYATGEVFSGKQTGGIKRFVELMTYMSKYHEVVLCSQDDFSVIQKLNLSSHIKLQTPENKCWNKILPQELRILCSNVSILHKIKRGKYDRVVVFDVPPALGLSLLGFHNIILMIRKDLLACEHSNLEKSVIKQFGRVVFLWFSELLCLFLAKRIVCQCEYDLKTLQRRHPLISKLIYKKSFIQINNVKVSSAQEIDSYLDFPHNSDNIFKVGFIGDFDNLRKGQDLMLEVAKRMSVNKDIIFYIVGGGLDLEKYKKQYSNEEIIFTGRISSSSSIMNNCDLIVVPSRTDSCPNVILESFGMGVPVIGSKVGGIPELLLNESAIFELNIESIEQLINRLKNDSQYYVILKENQIKRKKELTFDWGEKMMNIIIQ